jgi:hypothetical protein
LFPFAIYELSNVKYFFGLPIINYAIEANLRYVKYEPSINPSDNPGDLKESGKFPDGQKGNGTSDDISIDVKGSAYEFDRT